MNEHPMEARMTNPLKVLPDAMTKKRTTCDSVLGDGTPVAGVGAAGHGSDSSRTSRLIWLIRPAQWASVPGAGR